MAKEIRVSIIRTLTVSEEMIKNNPEFFSEGRLQEFQKLRTTFELYESPEYEELRCELEDFAESEFAIDNLPEADEEATFEVSRA